MNEKSQHIVITPGGARPADHVHTVASDEAVQRGATGEFIVTRQTRPDFARTRELLATGLYAITPGGIRPKSMIHTVEPGQVVERTDGVFKRFDLYNKRFF